MPDGLETVQDDNSQPVSQASQRSLTPRVSDYLVKGVPFRCLLVGAGRPFRSSGQQEAPTQLRPCRTYNIFVSHDWQTSRWLKYASLLVLFNSKAAALATLVVSVVAGLLISYGILPNNNWVLSIGYLTFALFFLFWQNIRDMFVRPQLAFLDKLTIPQDNEGLKEQCILGLAGFLERTEKLVILWSEEYVSRLWCIYEFTVFMRMHPDQGQVQAVPVMLPLLLLLHGLWWLAVRLLVFLFYHILEVSDRTKLILTFCFTSLFFFVTYPLQAWVGRRLTKNLQNLARQLRNFDIHECKCSCCSAGHLKQSGERIPCDRALIYQILEDWYGKNAEQTDELHAGLRTFNEAVRAHFADRILSTWGRQWVPINMFIYTVCSTNTPFLITRIPDAIQEGRQQPSEILAWVVTIRALIVSWAQFFPSMLLYLWACKTMWSLTLQYSRWPISTGAISLFFVCMCGTLPFAMCTMAAISTPTDSLFAPLLALVASIVLAIFLMRVSSPPLHAGAQRVEGSQTERKECDPSPSVRDDLSSFSI